MTERPDEPQMDPAEEPEGNDVPDRLGFREMVPASPDADTTPSEQSVHIPEFDLGRQMMARHRERTARKRKSPKQQAKARIPPLGPLQPPACPDPSANEAHPGFVWSTYASRAENSLIAEIVRRDILRLCQVGRARR